MKSGLSSHLLPSLCTQELVELINSNRVLVVSGETGCGKTTQVTQFILDDYINRGVGSVCRVVCTQPRRISAISVCTLVVSSHYVGFSVALCTSRIEVVAMLCDVMFEGCLCPLLHWSYGYSFTMTIVFFNALCALPLRWRSV